MTGSSQLTRIHNNVFSSNGALVGGHVATVLFQSGVSMINNVFQYVTSGSALAIYNRAASVLSYNDYVANGDGGGDDAPSYPLHEADDLTNLYAYPSFSSYSNDDDNDNDDMTLGIRSPLRDAGSPDFVDRDGSISDIGRYGGPDSPFLDNDGDGMPDYWETFYGLDPASSSDGPIDTDADGYTNKTEYLNGTSPESSDTDEDGVSDGAEIAGGTNPSDGRDHQPIADAGADQRGMIGQTLELNGGHSSDPNDDVLTYEWTLDLVPEGSQLTTSVLTGRTSVSTSFSPDRPGLYELSLVVSDGVGFSEPDHVQVFAGQLWHVPDDFTTIQVAIDAARTWDYIEVARGIYEERISFKGKSVSVTGAGEGVSIIDGQNLGPVITFNTSEDEWAELSHFTLRHGRNTNTGGGCVYIEGAQPHLHDLEITGCEAVALPGGGIYARTDPGQHLVLSRLDITDCEATGPQDGGGIYLNAGATDSTITVEDCSLTGNNGKDGGAIYVTGLGPVELVANTLAQNTATRGAGLYSNSSDLNVLASLFYENVAIETGGAIAAAKSGMSVSSCVVVNNTADKGGGLFSQGSYPLTHSVLVGNTATSQGGNIYISAGYTITATQIISMGARAGGGIYVAGTLVQRYSNSYQNKGGNYVNSADPTSTQGNVSVDPRFLRYSADTNSVNDNYQLQALSPMRDAGDPSLQDVDGSRADIGVYGGPFAERVDMDRDGLAGVLGDCDDWNAEVPDAIEQADGADQDCDGRHRSRPARTPISRHGYGAAMKQPAINLSAGPLRPRRAKGDSR